MNAFVSPSPRFDELPDEILLQILCFLEPQYLPKLQLVSRKLRDVCLDNELWKRHTFSSSPWYSFLNGRRRTQAKRTTSIANPSPSHLLLDDPIDTSSHAEGPQTNHERHLRLLQDMANWDPVCPGERVSWYDEYIQRQGAACVNWLETPRVKEGSFLNPIDARGVALFNPNNGDDGLGTLLAVSPLDDGSVCLWDVNGSKGKQGSIIATSAPEILFMSKSGDNQVRRSKRIDSGVTECVTVNNNANRAFFAVQSHLVEVDLTRLEVVSRESFEWSITTLSPIHDDVPLTVGTSLGIHLHDFRARTRVPHDVIDQVDGPGWDDSPFKSIFDPTPLPPYASLSQPTPTSILHLPRAGDASAVSDDIYVAGRFSSILHYDRRKFPKIIGSLYSGAQISSLTALPWSFSPTDHDMRRSGLYSADEVLQSKTKGDGRTLIAGGVYKTKGSLELYGLSATGNGPMVQQDSLKNRFKAASSIILSVTNHGTKIVCSDGTGLIKWFERDGNIECRRIRIGHSDPDTQPSLFASMPGSDDLARKIISTQPKPDRERPNEDNILFWTGEKLGMVSFTAEPLFTPEDFEDANLAITREEEQRRQYSNMVQAALLRQADEARMVKGLGMDAPSG